MESLRAIGDRWLDPPDDREHYKVCPMYDVKYGNGDACLCDAIEQSDRTAMSEFEREFLEDR